MVKSTRIFVMNFNSLTPERDYNKNELHLIFLKILYSGKLTKLNILFNIFVLQKFVYF